MATAARLAVRQLLRVSQQEASQATRTFKSSAAPRKVHYVSSRASTTLSRDSGWRGRWGGGDAWGAA